MMNWHRPLHDQSAIAVNVATASQLLEDIAQRFANKQGFSVATLNLDHVVKLQSDTAFAGAYAEHTHVTADGNPIVWLSHLAGQPEVALVPGSELIDPVAKLAEESGTKVALFGATDASLQAAASALVAKYPALDVALVLAPPMGFDPNGAAADEAIAAIDASGAGLAFLALGAPKQEVFAARAQKSLGHVGFLSIGAGLDFISGSQQRAPIWVRKLALEWLWRLMGNPKRLAKRYGACILVLPKLALRALSSRKMQNA